MPHLLFDQSAATLAVIPSSFGELGLLVVIVLAIGLLYLVGNLLFGGIREGGVRLVVFVVGSGAGGLGWFICRKSWAAFAAQDYPGALGFLFGCAVVLVGVWLLLGAIFASNQKVRGHFAAVMRAIFN